MITLELEREEVETILAALSFALEIRKTLEKHNEVVNKSLESLRGESKSSPSSLINKIGTAYHVEGVLTDTVTW